MPHISTTPRVVALAALLAMPGTARAAVICVGTSAELEGALILAALNGYDDEIRVQSGDYPTLSPNGFRHLPSSPTYDEALVISGGWVDGCTRFVGNAWATVLDGQQQGPVLTTETPGGSVTIRNLAIVGGSTPDVAGTLRIVAVSSTVGPDVEIERVVVAGNLGVYNVYVKTQGGVVLTGSDFVDNVSGVTAFIAVCCAAGDPIYALGNTFAGNDATSVGGLQVLITGRLVYVGNNIFWDNEEWDFAGASDVTNFFHNIHGDVHGTITGAHNLQLDPMFVDPAAGDHRLQAASPARDSGAGGWPFMPSFDLLGTARPQNGSHDIGAYELAVLFADGFEAGDSTAWSSQAP